MEQDQRPVSAVGLRPDGAGDLQGETGGPGSLRNDPGFGPEEQSKRGARLNLLQDPGHVSESL